MWIKLTKVKYITKFLDDALSVWRPVYTTQLLPKAWFSYGRNGRKDWVTIFLIAEIQLKIGRVIIYREYVWFKYGLQVKTIIVWPMRKIVTLSFMTVTTIWKPGLKLLHATCLQLELYCVIGDVFGCMIRSKHIKWSYERWGESARVPKLAWFKGAQAGKFSIQTQWLGLARLGRL
jgi:hypothetical protein